MPSGFKIVQKNVTTTYKFAVDSWVEKAGGLANASNALKAASSVAKMIPLVGALLDSVLSGLSAVALEERLKSIEAAIAALRAAIAEIYEEFARVEERFARGETKVKKLRLDDIGGEIDTVIKQAKLPGVTPRDLVNHCIALEVQAEFFLASGLSAATGQMLTFDLWRAAAFNEQDDGPRVYDDHFSTWPTLLLYATLLISWVELRKAATKAGQKMPAHNEAALARHAAALSVRPGFQRGGDYDDYSLLEFAMRHIPYSFNASSRGLACVLTEHVSDQMGFRLYSEEVAEVQLPPRADCWLGTFPGTEYAEPHILAAIDELAGVALMRRLHDLLAPPPDQPSFGRSRLLTSSTVYFCSRNGDLQLQRVKVEDGRPSIAGGAAVGNGWTTFRKVIPNGQFALYGLKPDGSLHWYWHSGHDTLDFDWKGPIEQRIFNAYVELFGSSDGVFYAVLPDGRIDWYCHDAVATGDPNAWRGPVRMPDRVDWSDAVSVFGVGDGRLYVLRADGSLTWHAHPGYLTGTADMTRGRIVARDWSRYRLAFADRPGQIFALDRQGRLDVFRHTDQPEENDDRTTVQVEPKRDFRTILDLTKTDSDGKTAAADGPGFKPTFKNQLDKGDLVERDWRDDALEPDAPRPPVRLVGPVQVTEGYTDVAYAFALGSIKAVGPR